MSLFGKDATIFSHLDLGILCHSSLQILSSSVRLDGKRWWKAIFRSLQRCSIGFKSGLWLGHSRTVTELLWSHSFVILAVCLGSLSCWKVNLQAQSEVLSTLEKVFVQDIPVLGRIHLSLDCNQSSYPYSWKTPPQHDAATTMLHCWVCIGQVMSSAWFLHTYRLRGSHTGCAAPRRVASRRAMSFKFEHIVFNVCMHTGGAIRRLSAAHSNDCLERCSRRGAARRGSFGVRAPLELRPKSSILVSSDQRILFVTILESFRCFLANSMRAFMCLALRRGFRQGHSAIKPRLVEGCSDGWLSTTFSHLPNASLELSHSDLWVLLYLSHQGSSPPIAQFGRTASSRKGSGRPKRLPFKDYGGHCALRNLKCSRFFFVTLARSVPCHNSVSELFRQFLWPHDYHLLWHALWALLTLLIVLINSNY